MRQALMEVICSGLVSTPKGIARYVTCTLLAATTEPGDTQVPPPPSSGFPSPKSHCESLTAVLVVYDSTWLTYHGHWASQRRQSAVWPANAAFKEGSHTSILSVLHIQQREKMESVPADPQRGYPPFPFCPSLLP